MRRFPALAGVPRVPLGSYPSPVQRVDLPGLAGELWIKRDDLDAPAFGGNKVRALEFLLGDVQRGDRVLTVGGEGSTHVLATAAFAAQLGARAHAIRWRHDMNPTALAVAERARALATIGDSVGSAARAFVRAARRRRGTRWVPAGGTSALGMLGHVNAALELAEQVRAGTIPAPARVVVALGSGGTAAGLALGFRIAALETTVIGARVAPRIAAGSLRVHYLAERARRWTAHRTSEPVPRVRWRDLVVRHDVYGGAYGRPLAAAVEPAAALHRAIGLRLDETYAGKAFALAFALARERSGVTLFWSTFDARWLSGEER